MIYPIVVFGAPVLREKCREIGPDYPEVKKLIEDMFLTLEEAEGVGLAAPQITYIMHELKAKGLLADTSAITVDEAKKSILEALEKRKV